MYAILPIVTHIPLLCALPPSLRRPRPQQSHRRRLGGARPRLPLDGGHRVRRLAQVRRLADLAQLRVDGGALHAVRGSQRAAGEYMQRYEDGQRSFKRGYHRFEQKYEV